MRKTLWLAALAGTLLTLSGCQEDEPFSSERSSGKGQISFLVESDPQEQVLTKGKDNADFKDQNMVLTSQDGDKLMFSMEISDIPSRLSQEQTLVTRGVPATNESLTGLYGTDEENGIGILSFWSESNTAPYIQNDWLKYENSSWTANNHTYYWPKTGTLDFWAWAPNKIDTEKYNVTRTFTNASVVKDGKIAFSYDLGNAEDDGDVIKHGIQDAKMQPDLIFSNVPGATTNNVEYHLDHALAAVRFNVTSTEVVKVTKISLDNVSRSGSCVYDPTKEDKFTWTLDDSKKGTYTQVLSKEIVTGEGISTPLCEDENGTVFMMLPQPISGSDRKVEITIQSGDDDPVTFSGFIPKLDGGWKAGKMYTYVISGLDGNLEIAIDDVVKDKTKNSLRISNSADSNNKCYMRACIIGAWYDKDNEIIAPWTVNDGTFDDTFPTDVGVTRNNWTLGEDGFYYYKYPVYPGCATGGKNVDDIGDPLFTEYTAPKTETILGSNLKMQIIAQGVRFDDNKASAIAAWGEGIKEYLSAEDKE